MEEFIRGPMVWVAFAVFLGGLVWQGVRFFSLTREKRRLALPPPPATGNKKKGKGKKKRTAPLPAGNWIQRTFWWLERKLSPAADYANRKLYELRFSVFGKHPVVTGVTVIFHAFLFVTPIFLLAHNQLLERSLGFGLPSLSEATTDMMTIVFLACGAFFLARRVFVKRVRAISTAWDYVLWLVTVAPFVTGFLAYRHWGDYQAVITAHIVTGELMLMLIPFTRLGHMIYFFLYRFFLGGEYSFGQGRRAW